MRYVIVGDGDERNSLEGLVNQLGVREHVRFSGVVDDRELPNYYHAADVFIHPNRIEGGEFEGFGIVFLEAAAASLPTIGGSTGGVPEAVEAGVTGLLVSGTNVDELAAAIRTLAASESLRRRMGEAGRRRVQEQFTLDVAAAHVTAIHESVAHVA